MKLNPKDLRKIQFSLVFFILLSACGAWLVHLALEEQKLAKAQRGAAQAELDQALGRLRQVNQEEQEIKLKSALFSNLAARGILGEEQRLDWVELLRDIEERRRLLDMEYEFAPQQALGSNNGQWGFYASTMKVQLQLLHEEDLLNFLADLRNYAKALVQVRNCNVSRIPRAGGTPGSVTANLQAQCTLDWITIRGSKPR